MLQNTNKKGNEAISLSIAASVGTIFYVFFLYIGGTGSTKEFLQNHFIITFIFSFAMTVLAFAISLWVYKIIKGGRRCG
jgi:hypothetical protein